MASRRGMADPSTHLGIEVGMATKVEALDFVIENHTAMQAIIIKKVCTGTFVVMEEEVLNDEDMMIKKT